MWLIVKHLPVQIVAGTAFRVSRMGKSWGQWVPRTMGNYGRRNRRENNSVQDNSDMGTIGAIVLMDKGQVTMQRRTMGTTREVNCLEKEMEAPR